MIKTHKNNMYYRHYVTVVVVVQIQMLYKAIAINMAKKVL